MATPIKAVYWVSDSPSPDSPVPPSTFTHIYFAFVQPDRTTFKLTLTENDQSMIREFFSFLQSLDPPVKTLLSIGGANNDLDVFGKMASTEQNRQALITSSIAIARQYGFDGFDLDWEFPRNAEEMTNLGLLYKQWSLALEREATANGSARLLLTSAVYFAPEDFERPHRAFPASKIAEYVDWINLMCYDYNIKDARFTTPPACLRNPKSNKNTEYGIQSWIQAGVPASKLVMGMPLYGRTWTLQNQANNGYDAPVVQVPEPEAMAYKDVPKPAVNYDPNMVACYSCRGTSWTGYDDVCCVEAKVRFAKQYNLAGYFFWALGQDTKDWTLSIKASDVWEN